MIDDVLAPTGHIAALSWKVGFRSVSLYPNYLGNAAAGLMLKCCSVRAGVQVAAAVDNVDHPLHSALFFGGDFSELLSKVTDWATMATGGSRPCLVLRRNPSSTTLCFWQEPRVREVHKALTLAQC